jgi:hypothetical protein
VLLEELEVLLDGRRILPLDQLPQSVAGRAKTSQRGALKTGQCFDDAYTSSV